MWNEPGNIIIAWLPLFPLMAVTLSLVIHLTLFVWGFFTSSFAHLMNWGLYIVLAIFLIVVTVSASIFLPEALIENMRESPPNLRLFWVLVASVVTTTFVVLVALSEHFLGRMIYISAKDGTIRFYSPARLWPAPPANHVDLVKPLRFDGRSVDVWGMENLRVGNNMTKSAIAKMVSQVNTNLPVIRRRGGQ